MNAPIDYLDTNETVLPSTSRVVSPNLPQRKPLMANNPCPTLTIQIQAIERHLSVLRQCLQMDNEDGLTSETSDVTVYTDTIMPALRKKLINLLSGPGAAQVETHLSKIGYPITFDDGNVRVYVIQGQYVTLTA